MSIDSATRRRTDISVVKQHLVDHSLHLRTLVSAEVSPREIQHLALSRVAKVLHRVDQPHGLVRLHRSDDAVAQLCQA